RRSSRSSSRSPPTPVLLAHSRGTASPRRCSRRRPPARATKRSSDLALVVIPSLASLPQAHYFRSRLARRRQAPPAGQPAAIQARRIESRHALASLRSLITTGTGTPITPADEIALQDA